MKCAIMINIYIVDIEIYILLSCISICYYDIGKIILNVCLTHTFLGYKMCFLNNFLNKEILYSDHLSI